MKNTKKGKIMQYIVMGLSLYLVLRIIVGIRSSQKEREREQDSAQMRAEFRRQQTESKRIVAEQIRQAKELAKHEEQLMKHEKRIADLEFKVEQAERDIEFLYEARGNLDGLNDHYKMLQCGTVPGSKEWIKYQNKIIALYNKTHTIETKMEKSQHIKEMAEKELCA